MKCLVLLKEVPSISDIKIDPETLTIDRSSAGKMVNPSDIHAVEAALSVATGADDSVTVLTMGPDGSDAILREPLGMGCKAAYRITDAAFKGADTLVTATVLHAAIEKLGPFDAIFTGSYSVDGVTAQVPSKLGGLLGIGTLTNAAEITPNENGLTIKRKDGNGYEELSANYPLLCSVTEEANKPRSVNIKGKMAAKKAVIPVLTNEDLQIPAENLISNSKVVNLFPPAREEVGQNIEGNSAAEKAENLLNTLLSNHYL